MSRSLRILALTLVLALALPGLAQASHSWGKYHWSRPSNPLALELGDNVSSTWDGHLAVASSDWSVSSVLDTSVATGGTSPTTCSPTSGRVEVCNAEYGDNGWLGVAQIWVARGFHITQGVAKMNDTYFNQAPYNTSAWRQLVMCQEVGHTFGLDHQDENFDNANLGSCMDYSRNPEGNEHPNAHDYEQLEKIYSHLDSSGGGGKKPRGNSHARSDAASEWGQLVASSEGGRAQTYVRQLADGTRVVTFVLRP